MNGVSSTPSSVLKCSRRSAITSGFAVAVKQAIRGGECGEALADEPRDVQVVGAEVVAPLRQAMGFVEHPGRDLAAGERGGEALVAELLRGTSTMPASPSSIFRSTSRRSGGVSRPFSATAE